MKNSMKNKTPNPVPTGFHNVTPYIVVEDASGFIDFIKEAFGGRQTFMMRDENSLITHATISIGDSTIMVSDFMKNMQQQQTAMLYLYLDEVDKTYNQAMNAGALSVHEQKNEFYGDRASAVKDRWGNIWWIATHIEDVEPQELEKRARQAMQERKEKGDEIHA